MSMYVISVVTRRDPEIIDDTESATGYAPLHHAAQHNQVATVDLLVEAGANLELQDRRGCTALHIAAAFSGCQAAVMALLRHGGDIEKRNIECLTPLLVAIEEGNQASAIAFIAAGADIRAAAHHSALELAIQSEYINVVRVLVKHGVSAIEPRYDNEFTPLHWAAWYKNAPAIDFFVECGANLEAKREATGETPLHLASERAGNLASIAALVRHGANIHARKVPSGDTPLHIAAQNCFFESSPRMVDALLKAGADETFCNATGETPVDLLEQNVEGQRGSNEYAELTLSLLINASRDRADRRWARRRSFVLCHALSDRVWLASREGGAGGRPPPFSVIDPTSSPPTGSEPKIREGGLGNHEESGGTIDISCDFSAVMGRLIGLQAGVFRTVMEFL